MRGGRGRGGRGRFGRGGGPSQDLIRDNLEDLGLDYADVFKKDNPNNIAEAGETYPTVDLVPPPNIQQLPDKQLYLIDGNNVVQARCQTSPFFITAQVEQKEIIRYADKKRSAPSGNLYDTIMSHFNNQHDDALKYVPAELLDSRLLRGLKPLSGKGAASHSGAGAGKGLDDLNLQKLEQAEKTHDPTATKEEEEEEGVNEEAEEVADDFEMDDDYGVDHYASDNEFGGDNGEFGEGGEADF